MNLKEEILNHFQISETEIIRISDGCKKEAIDYGKSLDGKFSIANEDFYLLDNISDYFWNLEIALDEKIKNGFELYELFPRYFQFLMPYYRVVKNPEYLNLTDDDVKNYGNSKEIIWRKFMHYMGTEKYYADPVGYVLWVEFFEDGETTNETWRGLIKFTSNKNAVKKLLEMSGPAPFELKEILYEKLILDKEFHESIFKSLLFSRFDLCGQINNEKALIILSKLELPKDILHFEKLKIKLLEK